VPPMPYDLHMLVFMRMSALGLTMSGKHSQNDIWIWQLPMPSSITCILGIYPTG
jgi:hypothetical protein